MIADDENVEVKDMIEEGIEPGHSPRQAWLLHVFIALGAAACIGIVFWQLLYNGPFRWHVSLPQFWQGGIEALILGCALAALQFWRRRNMRLVLSVLLAELYLRRHAVDAALLVDLFYFELVFALGAGIGRLCGAGKPEDLVGYLRAFLLGFCTWSVCAWGASALGFGSVVDLRILTLALVVPAVAARSTPACLFVERRVGEMPTAHRAAAAALLAWFLVLFAHSAITLGFDSVWYGLRGDRVLAAAGSAFASQGLASPVHYFPKAYELFLLPVSGFGSASVVLGVGIGMLALLAAASWHLLGELGVRDGLARLAGVALVVTLPAVANIALEAKPDVFSALLLACAWIHAAIFVRTRTFAALLWLLALLALSTQAKLTAIPFAAALFAATAFAAVWRRPASVQRAQVHELRLALAFCALVLITCAFTTARTLLLAGVPTIGPDPLLRLWFALGFDLRFPAGTLQWSHPVDWTGIPMLLVDLLFRPQLLPRIIITWIGNVWFWLGLVALVCTLLRYRREAPASAAVVPGVGLAAAAFVVMFCWGFDVRGGDGNYFIAGIVPATLLGLAAVRRRLVAAAGLRPAFLLAVLAFALFQGGYSLLSATWNPGTRGFDLDFTRGVHAQRELDRKVFAENGLAAIDAYLRHLHRVPRVIGCTLYGETLGMRLQASFEGYAQLSYSHRDATDSAAHFLDYLKRDGIDYLLLPLPGNPGPECKNVPVLAQVAADLDRNAQVEALRDRQYVLYDLSGLR